MDEISLGVMRPWYARGFTPLLIVMGLIGSAYWAAKRYLPAARSAECGMLNIVARTNVSPKQTLALIQLSRRFVLLGITADRIEPLCSITDPNEVAELALKLGTGQGSPTFAFSEALNEQARDYADALEEDGADPNVSPQQVAEATKQLTGLVGKLKQLRAG